MKRESHSENETADLAASFAGRLSGGEIICLSGPLGAGKSVFARALIRALCGDDTLEVPSPTYTLLQTYDSSYGPIWHFDLYRIEDPEEIYEIGWEEALSGGIVLIEWPERLGTLLPEKRVDIDFRSKEDEARFIQIYNRNHDDQHPR